MRSVYAYMFHIIKLAVRPIAVRDVGRTRGMPGKKARSADGVAVRRRAWEAVTC